MKSFFHALLFAASFAGLCPLYADEHDLEVLTVGNDKFLRWHGQADRTYFIQVSDPNDHLRKWTWAPIIETGNDEDISYEVDGTANKGFFRLWFSDEPTTDPDGDDFDGDGLTNHDEVTLYQTNPLNSDTDSDGLLDGWEVANLLDPNDGGTVNVNNGASGDPDHDGLTNEEEQNLGSNPNDSDSDDDGITDGGENDQGTDPNDLNDTPDAEWFVLTGDLKAGVKKTRSRTVTIPAGKTRVIAVVVASEEYPDWTSDQSEFNDTLEWIVRPVGGQAITGSIDVNSRHEEWEDAELEGREAQGFYPAHYETLKVMTAGVNSPLSVEIDLSATNIGDDSLPSTVMVAFLPIDIVAVFGFGGEPGKVTTKAYLENAATIKSDNVYLVKGKAPGGADKTYTALLGENQADLQIGLSAAGSFVVFDGHSNMGMGPSFVPADIKRLSDFMNIGNPQTAINWPYFVQDEYPDLTTITANEIAGTVSNYNVPNLAIAEKRRYPNTSGGGNGVPAGGTFSKTGTGMGQKHFNRGNDHFLIVNGGSADLPVLAYDSFFYNSCNTGRDYIEVFSHGTMFYTGATCSDGESSREFVNAIIDGKRGAEVLQVINAEEDVNYIISR